VRANPIVVTISLLLGSAIVSGAIISSYGFNPSECASEKPIAGSADSNFDKMMLVLTHARCTNCHPNDGIPKQGDDSHPHYFGIARGKDNHGFDATKCNTCHQDENNQFSGVPGAPEWSLAPDSMRWEGLSRTEIAESILDRKRNGDRNHEQIMHHMTEHALVLWAWEPGVDANGEPRQTPPVPKDVYIAAVKKWFEDGAVIPEK
jgi:cytochrome c553